MALYSVVALGNTDDSDPCGYSPSPHSLLLPQAISVWSNDTSSSSEMKSFHMYIVLHLIIAVLSTIGNSFVIASVIFINSTDRNNQMILKLSLAVVDLATIVGLFITSIAEAVGDAGLLERTDWSGLIYKRICTSKAADGIIRFVNNYVINSSVAISFYHISLMASIKLYSIALPFQYKNFSKKKLLGWILAAWLFPVVFVTVTNEFTSTDNWGKEKQPWLHKLTYWVTFVVPYLITIVSTAILCVVFFFYQRRQRTLLRNSYRGRQQVSVRSRAMSSSSTNTQESQRLTPDTVSFMRIIVLIVAGYTTTCLPFIVKSYVRSKAMKSVSNALLFNFILSASSSISLAHHDIYLKMINERYFFTVLYLNTIVDCLVYSGCDPKFRSFVCSAVSCGQNEQNARAPRHVNIPMPERPRALPT